MDKTNQEDEILLFTKALNGRAVGNNLSQQQGRRLPSPRCPRTILHLLVQVKDGFRCLSLSLCLPSNAHDFQSRSQEALQHELYTNRAYC